MVLMIFSPYLLSYTNLPILFVSKLVWTSLNKSKQEVHKAVPLFLRFYTCLIFICPPPKKSFYILKKVKLSQRMKKVPPTPPISSQKCDSIKSCSMYRVDGQKCVQEKLVKMLCWTGLNWFIGHSVRITTHTIKFSKTQELTVLICYCV